MATATTDDSASDSNGDSGTSSVADKLETAGTVIWTAFLALVVVFTLIPAVGLWLGTVPFDSPSTTPYFALVGVVLVGTVALIAAAVYDV